jgi:hypothetical protein
MEPKKHIKRNVRNYKVYYITDKKNNRAIFEYYNLKGVLNYIYGSRYNIYTDGVDYNEYRFHHFKDKKKFGQTKSNSNKKYMEKLFKVNLSTPSLSNEEMEQANWEF